jgi:hypothetical protein
MFFASPAFQRVNDFVSFVSLPVFYLVGDTVSDISIVCGTLMLVLYWVIIGIGVACGLVWLYFFILRKCIRVAD